MLSRREFLASAAVALPAALLHQAHAAQTAPTINAARLRSRIEHLSTFGRPAGGGFESGVSRVAYSEADRAARTWLLGEVRAAGLTPRIDPAGNVFARLGPLTQPAILFGSHIDSVPGGGNFDGDLGTLASLEVLQMVQSARITPRHPLEMVLWAHEESTAFGRGTAASRIVAGDLAAGDMDQVWNGLKRADGIRLIGGDPSRIEDAVRPRGAWHAYLELHIEQGGTLESSRVDIGIVEGIVAIHRYDATITGFANHAGTTPMAERRDALFASSQLVLAVRDVVTSRQGRQVGTVGRMEVTPNSPNVIPGKVTLSVEVRDLSEDVLKSLGEDIQRRAAAIARDTRTEISMVLASRNPPALADSGVQQAVASAAALAKLTTMRLPSGAGHDAQMIAALCPMGMIFVPSVGGVSHSPLERTTWEDCARGAAVLAGAVLQIDSRNNM